MTSEQKLQLEKFRADLWKYDMVVSPQSVQDAFEDLVDILLEVA